VIPTKEAAFAGTLIAALTNAASRIARQRVTARVRVSILHPSCSEYPRLFVETNFYSQWNEAETIGAEVLVE
jgi:hypothetical protein